jgi:hypothetical protein
LSEGIGKALDVAMGLLIQTLDGPAPRPVVALARVMLHLPSACPYQSVLRLALGRMPRLIS